MNHSSILRIGTRGSPLALFQANLIANKLKSASGGSIQPEIVTFTTKGDQLTTERLINSGGKGLFTREIDSAVDLGLVDIGVHSLKDVPSVLPKGQSLIAFPPREDPRDGLVTTNGIESVRDLARGATLGTASLRRESQTLALRPDLNVVPFRGSVQTRLNKLQDGQADATYLAMAGLNRLGLGHLAHAVPTTDILPAAGQGIIAVAGRIDALPEEIYALLTAIDHAPTRAMATAERAFLAELDGSCRTAMAAQLEVQNDHWTLRSEVLQPDGQIKWTDVRETSLSSSLETLHLLGTEAARAIRKAAGGDLPVFEA